MIRLSAIVLVLASTSAFAQTTTKCTGDVCTRISKEIMEEHKDRYNSTRFGNYTLHVWSQTKSAQPVKMEFFLTCDLRKPTILDQETQKTEKVDPKGVGMVSDIWRSVCKGA